MIRIALLPWHCVPSESSADQIRFKLLWNAHETANFRTILFPCDLIVVFLIAHHRLVVQIVVVHHVSQMRDNSFGQSVESDSIEKLEIRKI